MVKHPRHEYLNNGALTDFVSLGVTIELIHKGHIFRYPKVPSGIEFQENPHYGSIAHLISAHGTPNIQNLYFIAW